MKKRITLLMASIVMFISIVTGQLSISVPKAHAAYSTELWKAVDITLHSSKNLTGRSRPTGKLAIIYSQGNGFQLILGKRLLSAKE
ncbi:hypothetical protein [Paenibacillus sp. GCM10027626]|uniref:hypothetical protein n=1 Tax=Paenibacillus sp. GCM10027626 TaxID=3273411 RepID=UPI003643753E